MLVRNPSKLSCALSEQIQFIKLYEIFIQIDIFQIIPSCIFF